MKRDLTALGLRFSLNDVVSGTTAAYSPNGTVTREQLAIMLCPYARRAW